MTSIKIVAGAAVAAFLAFNAVGAAIVLGGVFALERMGDVTEAFADDDDNFTGAGFDRNDGDGYVDDIEVPEFGEGGKIHAVRSAEINPREAEEVALAEVSGRIVETKLEGKDGFPQYEIEVYDEDGRLHEVLVGAREGEVVGRKVEEPEESYEIGYLLDQTRIDRDEAETTATAEFPGLVIENKLDGENGFAVWEIETLDEESGLLHEIKVNARNGDVLFHETKGDF